MIEIYETPYGNVEVNVDAHRAIVKVSSGFDSALMLYMICLAAKKYNPNLEIYPVTARRTNSLTKPYLKELFDRVDNYINAVDVVEWVRNIFPDIDIKDNLLYDSYFWQYCQDDPIMGPNNTYVMAQTMPVVYARLLPYREDDSLKYKSVIYNGVTKNPDFELGGHNPEVKRNLKIPKTDENCVSIKRESVTGPKSAEIEPFRNADKRITFWLADQLEVLDTLLRISRSCEGPKELSNDWTEECHHCWWCYERTWAQETYKNQQSAEQEKYKSEKYFHDMRISR